MLRVCTLTRGLRSSSLPPLDAIGSEVRGTAGEARDGKESRKSVCVCVCVCVRALCVCVCVAEERASADAANAQRRKQSLPLPSAPQLSRPAPRETTLRRSRPRALCSALRVAPPCVRSAAMHSGRSSRVARPKAEGEGQRGAAHERRTYVTSLNTDLSAARRFSVAAPLQWLLFRQAGRSAACALSGGQTTQHSPFLFVKKKCMCEKRDNHNNQ